ncbi:CCA tRNA nucleotidyltransferase [Bartonella sp. DGB2]|uniref:CCA tRNA nucleotidyltransferase n=1 Tax=Bartonella sp. DGB2 TaxID=3388426 RepID=UPI00399027CD
MLVVKKIPNAAWLFEPELQSLLSCLNQGEEEARIVGGAVRNSFLGEQVSDIDIATTCLPQMVCIRAQACGFRAIPTGLDYGTITVVGADQTYEVTTLRADISPDGRRTKVEFSRDWAEDAARRDFTINALYCDCTGALYDYVGGVLDIEQRQIRFIGEAQARVKEDYLRILRFFRMFAYYGHGRPDKDGLKACARLKHGLEYLSRERIWAEFAKLLAAPDPARTLLWMRQTGILTLILSLSEKWGIDAIHGLLGVEKQMGWAPDPLLRLMSLIPPDATRLRMLNGRFSLSNKQKNRLQAWAQLADVVPIRNNSHLEVLLYKRGRRALCDYLALSMAQAEISGDGERFTQAKAFYCHAAGWACPSFPLRGEDLLAHGFSAGPMLGKKLRDLETLWVETGFCWGREQLLATLGSSTP